MSRSYIARELREQVEGDARRRCGYCLSSEAIVGMPMEIDHMIPEVLGGPTERENLWLACPLCNAAKGRRIQAQDPVSREMVRLFNPRYQVWSEHFRWSLDGTHVIGLSASGRATVVALNLNRPSLVMARRSWVAVGWHPPLA